MQMIDRPSPNHNARPGGQAPDMLMLHYTGMQTAEAALQRLCDPAAKVSAHYTVDEDGTVYTHVPEDRRAWHAGAGFWQGETDINGASIGIEIVNPGHEFGYRPFPAVQMASVLALSRRIVDTHRIHPLRVIGHSDSAPDRKTDPGELFDWPGLAAEGVGFWPDSQAVERKVYGTLTLNRQTVGQNLRRIGYDWPVDTEAGSHSAAEQKRLTTIVTAFQRHFRRDKVTGEIDQETAVLAEIIAGAAVRGNGSRV